MFWVHDGNFLILPVRYLEHVTVNVTIAHMSRGELEVRSAPLMVSSFVLFFLTRTSSIEPAMLFIVVMTLQVLRSRVPFC